MFYLHLQIDKLLHTFVHKCLIMNKKENLIELKDFFKELLNGKEFIKSSKTKVILLRTKVEIYTDTEKQQIYKYRWYQCRSEHCL